MKFLTAILVAGGVTVFGLFTYAVRGFAGGSICLQGPGNVLVETQLGDRKEQSGCGE